MFSHLHQMKSYQPGEFIYAAQEPAESMFIITKGRVKLGEFTANGEERTLAILREGEVFGEMVMAGHTERREFAQCLEKETQLCILLWGDLRRLMRDDADLSIRIVKWFGLKMERLERKVESLTFKDSRTRIIDFLKEAVVFKGKQIGDEWMIRTKLTHADIATLTATSRQTVSEVLNDLRRENKIFFERGKILIRNIDNLK